MKVMALDVMGVAGHSFHIFLSNALAELGVDVFVITTKKQELDFSQAKFIAKKVLTAHYDKKSKSSALPIISPIMKNKRRHII